jgi:hypothetical protein
MSVEKAIVNILEGNLDEMRKNFSVSLSEKAIMKLDEKKVDIGQKYFGQVFESSPAAEGRKAAKEDDESREKHMKKYGKVPARLTGELADKFVARQKKKLDEVLNNPKKKAAYLKAANADRDLAISDREHYKKNLTDPDKAWTKGIPHKDSQYKMAVDRNKRAMKRKKGIERAEKKG